ncbi:subtilisin-like protein [Clathrospora elynae]|uniref:Subtilisin-like protein n=1 Tax=Clathrospora elynae TaxID=706981 RepID=A0A6A5SLT7_9PLEO|nr:subtilisin-like protein [Clathrospora elynae]
MRTTLAFASLVAAATTVLAVPQITGSGFLGQKGNSTACDNVLEKEFIVMLNRDDYAPGQPERMLKYMAKTVDDDDVLWTIQNTKVVAMGLNATECDSKKWNTLAEVAFVEEKLAVKSFATQSGATWGLQRVSSETGASGNPLGTDFTYTFDNEKLGAGVDIYILDTGVRTSHAVFTGRATQGFTATGSFTDGDGHGTHCAGTAGGAKFGVAQGANIIEVKVLGDDGSGSSSDTMAGLDFVIKSHTKRKTQPGFVGSVMSMSWGLQGRAKAVDEFVLAASEAGIHASVAAGNDGADACTSTPAGLGGANSAVVTVGSVNIDNEVSTFSNVGKCVDIYGPGEQIISSWSTGDTVINVLSGTSMACPHNTGVMAFLMAQDPAGLGQNPAALKAKLLEVAREGKVTGSTGGSANLLLSNGAAGNASRRLTKNYVVPEHSGLSGSPAARAAAAMANDITFDKRFQLHSRDAQLRF